MNEIIENPTTKQLDIYTGKQVTVWCGTGIRNSFDTQISISGTLEKHSEKEHFRIVDSDNPHEGSYVYFKPEDIIVMMDYQYKTFRDGSQAVIQINIQNNEKNNESSTTS